MNTLYFAPGACSIGIHILLEEIGAPYGLEKVNLMEGEQHKPGYLAVNPKAKVPSLKRDDGSIITEYPAVAYWLAGTNPDKKLWPADLESQVLALETLDYITGTVHTHGYARIFRPGNFTPEETHHDAVKAKGADIGAKGLAILEKKLAGRDWLCGAFSIADTAIFFLCFWHVTRLKGELSPNLAGHYARMLARPSVQAVLKQEGFAT